MRTTWFATVLLVVGGALPATPVSSSLPPRPDLSQDDPDAVIAALEARLAEAPDDADGWRELATRLEALVDHEGRSVLILADAADAWDQVARLEGAGAAPFRAARARLRAGALSDRSDLAREMIALAGLSTQGDDATALAEVDWLAALHLGDQALSNLRERVMATPDSIGMHRGLIDMAVRLEREVELQGFYVELAGREPNATILWYQGYLERLLADLASRERRNTEAAEGYARCVELMRAASDLNPGYAESALWVEIQARVASAWSALDADEVDRAETEWLAVLDEAPDFAKRADGLGRNVAQGLGRLGGRYHARDDIVKAQSVSRRVAEATDDAWSWNNVGYLLREIASDTETSGESGAFDIARTTFVQSYRAYQRAAGLAPHEPRIVNDTALIQVYHLQDDLDGAEEMLLEAIRVGEAALIEMGDEPEESERFPIAQAVGDAYQNLGFLYYRLRDDPGKARGFFLRSVETDSGARRGVKASIRAIDAGRPGLAPDPPPEVPPQPPSEQERIEAAGPAPDDTAGGSEEPRSQAPVDREVKIRWERSLALAVEAAAREELSALVYHRVGGGVGPSVEYLQRYLHSEAFERAAAGGVTVLADRLRHTFVDRGRDGRLVFCPRAERVTCAEHIACAEELEPRWREQFGRIDLMANGLFRITGAGLERIGLSQDTFERFRPGRDFDASESVAAHVPAPTPSSDPGVLAQSSTLAERRALEALLFDSRDDPRRIAAVSALAANPGPDNDELLVALVRQREDPALSAMALGSWRPDLGTEAPLMAWQSSDRRVRAAAARALAMVPGPTAERVLIARWVHKFGSSPEADASLVELAEGLSAR